LNFVACLAGIAGIAGIAGVTGEIFFHLLRIISTT
jgi:hypothetical protein